MKFVVPPSGDRTSRFFLPFATLLAATLPACTHADSVLNPAGTAAHRTAGEFWLFFTIACAVYLIVMTLLLIAIARRRQLPASAPPETTEDPARHARIARLITTGIAFTTVILFVFLLSDFFTGRALSANPQNPIHLHIVARQWWWEIRYNSIPWEPNGSSPHGVFTTANEIHLPVGVPAQIDLASRDVIHSFWIPRLNGKKDAIPGQDSSTWIVANEPGTFSGRCAEYCGDQHANMQIWVVAEPMDTFKQWLANQRKAVQDPAAQNLLHGRAAFLGNSCVLCHTVDGTPARGAVGPNLTHVASRKAIAAGAFANNKENLERWILNPNTFKPGTQMPQNPLKPEDLHPLVDWLQTLK